MNKSERRGPNMSPSAIMRSPQYTQHIVVAYQQHIDSTKSAENSGGQERRKAEKSWRPTTEPPTVPFFQTFSSFFAQDCAAFSH